MSDNTNSIRNDVVDGLLQMLNHPDEWTFNIVADARQLLDSIDAFTAPPEKIEEHCHRPIIAIDVDGTIHRYFEWKGVEVLDGGPLPGAMEAIRNYVDAGYSVHIISSRLHQSGGMAATKKAIHSWALSVLGDDGDRVFDSLSFSAHKPTAVLTIDDRAFRFCGRFPEVAEIKKLRPWRPDGDVPEAVERPDMDRGLMTLIFGMVTALAFTSLRSDRGKEARFAVEEIQRTLADNGEALLAEVFAQVLKAEPDRPAGLPRPKAKVIRVRLSEKTEAGLFFASSEDLKGLTVCDEDPDALLRKIPGDIQDLYAASGEDVLVEEVVLLDEERTAGYVVFWRS